jgi:chromatin remodeling complex protein RSC6
MRETINYIINFQASRAELMKLLWAYLKKNELQCDDNKQFFIPDKKMVSI